MEEQMDRYRYRVVRRWFCSLVFSVVWQVRGELSRSAQQISHGDASGHFLKKRRQSRSRTLVEALPSAACTRTSCLYVLHTIMVQGTPIGPWRRVDQNP
ncbi:hypothetical protein K432DRAFT_52053 [Lepidopterella palustris CBS 459.81]|uniref:Uncharacterized protein n=1 Tax=Lepidopterella palustris CBS 459.81 TaxID=1314670 RepID=A0A8E2JKF0_9PEZI|nr:hypothetical protein K432DRAFT_52053 [Lepidopterella palustris CBS 459.81]